jgi:hypothetical protein
MEGHLDILSDTATMSGYEGISAVNNLFLWLVFFIQTFYELNPKIKSYLTIFTQLTPGNPEAHISQARIDKLLS